MGYIETPAHQPQIPQQNGLITIWDILKLGSHAFVWISGIRLITIWDILKRLQGSPILVIAEV